MNNHYNLIISSLRGGGAELNCVNFANWLVGNGEKVTIIVLNLNNARLVTKLDSKILIHNLEVKNSRKSFFKIGRFLKKNNIKKVLCFNHQLSLVIYLSKTLFKLKTKVILRNPSNLYVKHKNAKNIWHGKITNALIKAFLKKNQHIISQCDEMSKMLIKHYNIDKNKISFAYNGISNRYKGLTLNTEKQNEILFVGRLVEMKRVDHIIEAFNLILKRNINAELKIIGEGVEEMKLREIVKGYQIEDKVSFYKYTANILEHYKYAKVTVLTSEYEGFPNVLIESLACGTPIVSYDISTGIKEIISINNGILVENANKEKLSFALEKALNSKWDYILIRESALKRFNIDSTFYHYKSVIDKC